MRNHYDNQMFGFIPRLKNEKQWTYSKKEQVLHHLVIEGRLLGANIARRSDYFCPASPAYQYHISQNGHEATWMTAGYPLERPCVCDAGGYGMIG